MSSSSSTDASRVESGGAAAPLATIVVVPRERFSYAKPALASVLAHTTAPHRLVYVDAGAPPALRRYLADAAQLHAFDLVRVSRYLSPNRARNLGLARVRTPYVVFLDNDVVVTPGWLESLVACAEETQATVVGPLVCEGEPLHTRVHCSGGRCGVRVDAGAGVRHLVEEIDDQGASVAAVRARRGRHRTELAEFHCMLVRADFLRGLGGLDEALLNTKEHVDLCLAVGAGGGSVWSEPASIVTYANARRLYRSDVGFYMLRWSDAWERASLGHLRTKWQLANDEYFARRDRRRGWRRRVTIIRPLCRRLPLGTGAAAALEKALVRVERVLNRMITACYGMRA